MHVKVAVQHLMRVELAKLQVQSLTGMAQLRAAGWRRDLRARIVVRRRSS